ncbi:MAG: NADH:flavin oxidoreductase/NADH oxidase [Comamonadaceae bacterium]|nr:MAG: NADH:flavin oxidoreductase/NADH oxidase [Comamonadaceae bacterium]
MTAATTTAPAATTTATATPAENRPLLFQPFKLRDVTLRNRIVVPPMHQYSGIEGMPTDWHLVNAGKFAAGGAGLVIVESTKVEKRGCGTLGDLGLWDDAFIAPMARLASFIKAQGSVAGLQLGHTGRKARTHRPWEGDSPIERTAENAERWDAWDIVAPSALPFGEGWPTPRALDRAEIAGAVEAWGQAARRAHEAGFDVLEIHGAHGYLIHSFLSPEANQRTDDYGGSEANRMRFAIEVVESVRRHWPEGKPLFMRLSIEDEAGWGPAENVALARVLKTKGVDVIDCSSGGLSSKVPNFYRLTRYGYQVPYAEQVRREAGIMTMAVGLIIHGDQAERILQDGQADLIGVGREILNNPNWPMDAAEKMGLESAFSEVPAQFGYWLAKRARRDFGCRPSTWQPGLEPRS